MIDWNDIACKSINEREAPAIATILLDLLHAQRALPWKPLHIVNRIIVDNDYATFYLKGSNPPHHKYSLFGQLIVKHFEGRLIAYVDLLVFHCQQRLGYSQHHLYSSDCDFELNEPQWSAWEWKVDEFGEYDKIATTDDLPPCFATDPGA